ncbi:UNVERIFIED_CONTAM: hypothetical protein O8I53_07375 [Campylobacter lari]
MPKLISTNYNFEQLKYMDSNLEEKTLTQKGKYLNDKFLDEAIIAPAVKSTIRESIRIFNKIIKLYSKE